MLGVLRLLLYPFSLLFGGIVRLRNAWYAVPGRSWKAPVPTVVVGNLSTGGTGKTPHAALVAEILLQHGRRPVSLSRGYGRKTRGFLEAGPESTASEVGDEPLMMKMRFPELPVFVCENRVEGIREILRRRPATGFVVLDDAYQHRALQPHLSVVLLTRASLSKPWLLLPAGDGREPLSALDRAGAVIVSKCPELLAEAEKEALTLRLRKYTAAPIFFSTYRYLGLVAADGRYVTPDAATDTALLFAGIADPGPLADRLRTRFARIDTRYFSDHHAFTRHELEQVLQKAGSGWIVTTEKDGARIHGVWPGFLSHPKLLLVPVVADLGAESKAFEKFLLDGTASRQ